MVRAWQSWFLAVLLVPGFLSCRGADEETWEAIFEGVAYQELELKEPRPLRAKAVRIDLKAPGIEIVSTPSNGDAPGETDGRKTSSFLKASGCQVAVNAAPFSPIHFVEGKAQDVDGLHISEGEVVSPSSKRRPFLAVAKGNVVTIEAAFDSEKKFVTAVAGFQIVLRDGAVLGADAPLHPRTAAAVTKDGRSLILLVVDGRQKGYSEGVSTKELGQMLKDLGGWQGINLDGGGTTTMVREEEGKPKILNRPIHGGIPGLERVSASHLGVRARPLGKRR